MKTGKTLAKRKHPVGVLLQECPLLSVSWEGCSLMLQRSYPDIPDAVATIPLLAMLLLCRAHV